MNNPLDRLRYHVTGAIERGEKEAITEQKAAHTPTPTYIDQAWYCAALVREWNEESFPVGDINRTHSLEGIYQYDAESGRFWDGEDDVSESYADRWIFQNEDSRAALAKAGA